MDPSIAATLTTRWLAHTEPAIRQGLLNACTIHHFVDGEMIYGFEQKQNCLWGIVSGTIRLFVAMSEEEPKLVHCAGPGFWFGAAAVITGGNRSMQAVAVRGVRLCSIDRGAVVQLAEKHHDVWRSVAVLSIMNQMISIGVTEDLMMRTPRKRIVATLLRMAGLRHGFQGNPPVMTVPVTQLELAEASCLSRSSAAEILKDLGSRGTVRTEYRSITVLDAPALKQMLAG